MDPIMKLLEEDEDESMHSGADVEALQAQLNRDISGDVQAASSSQPSESDTVLSEGITHTSSQSFAQWQKPSQEQNNNLQIQQNLESELKQQTPPAVNQQATPQQGQGKPIPQVCDKVPIPIRESNRMPYQESESQFAKLQKMSDQQASGNDQARNPIFHGKQIPFAVLLPTILPQLDKDRDLQLRTLYNKLKKNEVPKDNFVRHMRSIVGDEMLKMAVAKVAQPRPPVRTPSASTGRTPLPSPQTSAQRQQNNSKSPGDSPQIRPSPVQMKTEPTNGPQSQELDRQNSRGMQVTQISPTSLGVVNYERDQSSLSIQGLSEKQQNHFHLPHSYRNSGGSYQPYSGTNINTPGQPVRPRQQSIGSTLAGGRSQAIPKIEKQNSMHDPNKVQGSSLNQFTTSSALQQNSSMEYVKREPVDQGLQGSSTKVDQSNTVPGKFNDEASERESSRMGSSESPTPVDSNVLSSARILPVSSPAMINARTPPKKPISGQKKPLETPVSLPPSKKQKVGGPILDQSIDQLNDVTAVSGVNLREEEEHLFSGPKEDSRASEASRRIVQEEEDRLILHKKPIQKKLAEIMAKCGLKSVSNDVERCLSLGVEERLRGLLSNLIRLSKQRVDAEKPRHRTLITSDVREQIMRMNLKAKEEWEKRQAEAEKIRKLNEPDHDSCADGDKEKDDGRSKSAKANRDIDDDKMRATAANVAARAAAGGDDMLSKWQLMAEQARQKRQGGSDLASGNSMNHKSISTPGRNTKDNQQVEKRGNANGVTFGSGRRIVRNQETTRVARSICVKDIIAVLEREPQMSKSTLMYRLYDRVR